MEIEEIKRKRIELEKEIAKLLKDFTGETGMEIVSLSLRNTVYQQTDNGESVYSYIVRADVTL
jgi:hypothetical protein